MLALVVAAACGGDDDTGTTSGGNGGGGGGGSSSGDLPTLKVMAFGQLEADTFAFPELVDGVRARVERANADDQLGQQVEVIQCNDQDDPNEAANCARRAVEEGVVAVVGAFSYQGASVLPILEEAGIPYVAHRILNPIDSQSPMAFPIDGGLGALFTGLGYALAEADCETPVLFREDTPSNQILDQFVPAGLQAGGLELARTIVVPTQVPDAAPAVQTAVSEGADCAALAINPTDIVKIINAFRQLAPDVTLSAGATALSPAAIEGLGDAAEGIIVVDQYFALDSDNEAIGQFHADMDEFRPDATRSFWSLKAWGGMELVLRMLEELDPGDRTAEGLAGALAAIDEVDLGIVGPFGTLEENPIEGLERVFNSQVLWATVTDGVAVPSETGFVDVHPAMRDFG